MHCFVDSAYPIKGETRGSVFIPNSLSLPPCWLPPPFLPTKNLSPLPFLYVSPSTVLDRKPNIGQKASFLPALRIFSLTIMNSLELSLLIQNSVQQDYLSELNPTVSSLLRKTLPPLIFLCYPHQVWASLPVAPKCAKEQSCAKLKNISWKRLFEEETWRTQRA